MTRGRNPKSFIAAVARDERGQAMVEYALMLALLTIVSIAVLRALGSDIAGVLLQTSNHMSQVSNP